MTGQLKVMKLRILGTFRIDLFIFYFFFLGGLISFFLHILNLSVDKA